MGVVVAVSVAGVVAGLWVLWQLVLLRRELADLEARLAETAESARVLAVRAQELGARRG